MKWRSFLVAFLAAWCVAAQLHAQGLQGGASGALTQISCVTTSGSQSTISFSSIPGTYNHLEVIGNARGDTAATTTTISLRINGDSGSNYDSQYVLGNGAAASAAESFAGTSAPVATLAAASGTAGRSSSFSVLIPNYAGTTFDKTFTSNSLAIWGTTTGTQQVILYEEDWRSASAVTSLTFILGAGNFVNNSVACLYGIL